MSWLITQVAEAEAVGDKVQIIAHIPPGESEAFESWSLVYYNMVNRYDFKKLTFEFSPIYTENGTRFLLWVV